MTKEELCSLIGEYFDDMIKGVVDIDKEILAVNAELHADIEAMCDFFAGNNIYNSTPEQMKRYFDSFAFALKSRQK